MKRAVKHLKPDVNPFARLQQLNENKSIPKRFAFSATKRQLLRKGFSKSFDLTLICNFIEFNCFQM